MSIKDLLLSHIDHSSAGNMVLSDFVSFIWEWSSAISFFFKITLPLPFHDTHLTLCHVVQCSVASSSDKHLETSDPFLSWTWDKNHIG